MANLKPYQFPKGVSGNPGGVPKVDVAAELARAIIENNEELIYKAFVNFQVLADRGYGKLREVHAIEHSEFKHLSNEQLEKQIQELEQKLAKDLGYIKVEPKILPPAEDDPKGPITVSLVSLHAAVNLVFSIAAGYYRVPMYQLCNMA